MPMILPAEEKERNWRWREESPGATWKNVMN